MKNQSILHAQEHLLYIHKTLDVPYQELLSVIQTYRISPQKIALYLQQLSKRTDDRTNKNRGFAGALKYA